MVAVAVARVVQSDVSVWWLRSGYLMGFLNYAATPFIILLSGGPRVWCLQQGNEIEEGSKDGCGVVPTHCVIAADGVWIRRQVPHGGGLLGVV
nr:unnamed protein product [Digitaria exilis]